MIYRVLLPPCLQRVFENPVHKKDSFCLIGISYLSRAQESAAKVRMGNPIPANNVAKSTSPPPIADTVFVERIKSRVKNWKNACKGSSTKTEGKKILGPT